MTQAIDVTEHIFSIPCKKVTGQMDMATWTKSPAYNDLVGFIQAMNDAVKDQSISSTYPVTKSVENLIDMISTMMTWIDDIPPINQPQRFGNKAFKTYYENLQTKAPDILKTALGDKYIPAIPEISVYLVEGIGNSTRIDYGTGHELSFVAFLCCLYKIGFFTQNDACAVVLKVFARYMDLVRKLQETYRMEPAGSHGVYSLDDFQFIPYIWGSSQLYNNISIPPASFIEKETATRLADDNLFMACIKYIYQTKTGVFAEHSNVLYNMSAVAMWSKINTGLIKMYKAETLSHFPVIQHFHFGSLLPLNPAV